MKYLLYSLLLFCVCFHIFTLETLPIPWFDETFFASISHGFWQHNALIPEVASTVMEHQPTFVYGPIYFNLTALSFKVFGFGIWQFRFLSLLAGFGVFILILNIKNVVLNQNHFNQHDLWWLVLFLIDPFGIWALHNGRMDLVALMLLFSAIYLFLKVISSPKYYHFIFIGVFIGLAILTTPRVGIVFIPFGALMCLFLYQNKVSFLNLTIIGFAAMLTYLPWFVFLGGLNGIKEVYFTNLDHAGAGDSLSNYLFPRFYVPKSEYVLIFCVVMILTVAFIYQRASLKHYMIWFCVILFVLFYSLIKDWGPYSIFILPFFYLVIMILQKTAVSQFNTFIIGVLICFNVVKFGVKIIDSYLMYPNQNPSIAYNFVNKYIPKGSKVIGDAAYYYAVIQNGSSYEYVNRYGTIVNREKMLRTKYKFEYVIVSENERESYTGDFDYFKCKNKLKLVSKVVYNPRIIWPNFVGISPKTYACSLYKVIH